MKKTLATIFAVSLLGVLSACSSPEQTAEKKEEAKPLEPRTGREAFQSMWVSARGWQHDAVPIQLKSIALPAVKTDPGKSGAWQAIFVSPAAGRARTYTWCAIESEGNLHKGVFAGPDEGWSSGGSAQPFPAVALKVDSDEALKTALAKSEEYVSKHLNTPVIFLLEQNRRFPDLSWRLLWGDSISTSDYSVYVDASTGTVLTKEKG